MNKQSLLAVFAAFIFISGCDNQNESSTENSVETNKSSVEPVKAEPKKAESVASKKTDDKPKKEERKRRQTDADKQLWQQQWDNTTERMEAEAKAPHKPQIVIIKSEPADSSSNNEQSAEPKDSDKG
ncbi:MAG: hypothetical protein ACWA5Q_12185 [bacterium]